MENIFLIIIIILLSVIIGMLIHSKNKDVKKRQTDIRRINQPEGQLVNQPTPDVEENIELPVEAKFTDDLNITEEFCQIQEMINSASEQLILLITGGAGTGKTTLIQWLQQEHILRFKSIAVVAFTGVAALVSKGKTIHSFFGIPPKLIFRDTPFNKLSLEKNEILEKLELLIIDEISMVRSDLMDGIDRILKESRRSEKPFGGVHLLMVGDPCQLPPIVGPNERQFFEPNNEKIRQLWRSHWFFHAEAFSHIKFHHILLKYVFRQKEDEKEFVAHLNKCRTLCISNHQIESVISYFNAHCLKPLGNNFSDAISITFTNKTALMINERKLSEIKALDYTFKACATGSFAFVSEKTSLDNAKATNTKIPAPYVLTLKVGAQVMLLVNNYTDGYVNGSIGIVSRISDTDINVQLPSGKIVSITPYLWESEDYYYNEEKQCIERKVDGTYTQFPLTLAWAITAHKSQGKTFDKVCIVNNDRAFTPGQMYVALSRIRSLNMMRITHRIKPQHFKIDDDLKDLTSFIKNHYNTQPYDYN